MLFTLGGDNQEYIVRGTEHRREVLYGFGNMGLLSENRNDDRGRT